MLTKQEMFNSAEHDYWSSKLSDQVYAVKEMRNMPEISKARADQAESRLFDLLDRPGKLKGFCIEQRDIHDD
jgi:hypothetical protein